VLPDDRQTLASARASTSLALPATAIGSAWFLLRFDEDGRLDLALGCRGRRTASI
jgi:hypothetical protein